MDPFHSPRLKLRRARHHIDNARSAIGEFLARRPFSLTVEDDPDDPDYQRITFRATQTIPEDVSLIVGDAVHNLWFAMDHLACALVRQRKQGQGDEKTYFPVVRDCRELPNQIKIRMGNADSDIQDAVKALQPCEGGNQAIYGLHAADNMDKHRIFLFLAQVTGSSLPFTMSDKGTVALTFTPQEQLELLEPGEAFRIKRMEALSAGQAFSASFDVAFAKPDPFLAEPVLPCSANLRITSRNSSKRSRRTASGAKSSAPPSSL